MKHSASAALVALFLIIPHAHANETRSSLTIIQGHTTRVLTEDDFRQLHLDSVVLQDPVYKKQKHYMGYWLSDIFDLAGVRFDSNNVLTFKALDGFKASIDIKDIQHYGAKAFVAVEDLDKAEGWEKIQHGKELVSPGPYYIVWQTPLDNAATHPEFPWAYQVTEISIHNVNEDQQKLFPDSNDKTDSVTRGYKIFQNNCMACHSINLEGGVVGPELNVPKNIMEYEDRKFLKSFISDPSSYRARSKMPTFNKILTPQDIDDVLDYLAWIGKHKT